MDFIETNHEGVIYMASPDITTAHAFTTRHGGVSSGIYSSLNLGMKLGDDPGCVEENYSRICRALGTMPGDIVCSSQIHSARIRVVSQKDRKRLFKPNPEQADGLVTCDSGVALTVFTADCVPILLHDPVAGAIGAVHAGWRGTAADIAGAAVQAMIGEFGCMPENIRAAIGPCISVCCYETGSDVADAMHKIISDPPVYKSKSFSSSGKFMADLKECNRRLLIRAGLRDISVSDECTCCENEKYWSHRFTGGKRGSQAAIIVLNKGV